MLVVNCHGGISTRSVKSLMEKHLVKNTISLYSNVEFYGT